MLSLTPITLPLIPTVQAIAVHGSATIDRGRKDPPPPLKRNRVASTKRSSVPRPSTWPAAIGRCTQAYSPLQEPHPDPSRRCCHPPLSPACAEPCPPRPLPSGLDHRTPHLRQEFPKPPCPPPPPTAMVMPTTSALSMLRGTRR
jgi:hypothetical protein